jgi:hypothetical protein
VVVVGPPRTEYPTVGLPGGAIRIPGTETPTVKPPGGIVEPLGTILPMVRSPSVGSGEFAVRGISMGGSTKSISDKNS